jgi:5'-nucleotidase
MRILVTNDDGIDSTGLCVLARAMLPHGDVVVAAPDQEYSGASAAIGSLNIMRLEMRKAHLDGISEAWAISAPPALCVLLARLGLYGAPIDLVVSGINPGANVGRAVYHSGTVGAALTARNGGISGVAVSQAVDGYGVEGQGWAEMLADMKWETAGTVASAVVGSMVKEMPAEPVVVNINVPNCELHEVVGWRHAEIGFKPPRSVGRAIKTPVQGHDDRFAITMEWGDAQQLPIETDGGAVEHREVAITYLNAFNRLERNDLGAIDEALTTLIAGSS